MRKDAIKRLIRLRAAQKELLKEVDRLKLKLASGSKDDLMGQVVNVNGVKLLVARMDDCDAKVMRQIVDQYKQKIEEGIVVIASGANDKVAIAVGVSPGHMAVATGNDQGLTWQRYA